MITTIRKQNTHPIYRIISGLVALAFIFTSVMPPSNTFAQVVPATVLNLPAPGAMVPLSSGFTPPMVNGITLYPDDPFKFDFLIGRGDNELAGEEFKAESKKLMKYFLAALTVPEDELWVNLSPYEEDRIIPESLSKTEMGRDLLTQDYMLKQLTASLMYPENELGEKFWNRIRNKVKEEFGTNELPVNTFNKVWIVPQDATVYETENTAVVIDSYLKVMLESDYFALENAKARAGSVSLGETTRNANIIREVIIPEIEREVNEGETFANLRQIYNSTILATWYKQNMRESLLGQVYIDQKKVKGIDTVAGDVKDKIYKQYLEAFNVGVYNYIREEYDESTKEMTPRKYFAGGAQMAVDVNSAAASPVSVVSAIDVTRNTETVTWTAKAAASPVSPVDNVKTALFGIIAKQLNTEVWNLPSRLNESLEEFYGATHDDKVEIAAAIESNENIGVTFTESEIKTMRTVKEILDLVSIKLATDSIGDLASKVATLVLRNIPTPEAVMRQRALSSKEERKTRERSVHSKKEDGGLKAIVGSMRRFAYRLKEDGVEIKLHVPMSILVPDYLREEGHSHSAYYRSVTRLAVVGIIILKREGELIKVSFSFNDKLHMKEDSQPIELPAIQLSAQGLEAIAASPVMSSDEQRVIINSILNDVLRDVERRSAEDEDINISGVELIQTFDLHLSGRRLIFSNVLAQRFGISFSALAGQRWSIVSDIYDGVAKELIKNDLTVIRVLDSRGNQTLKAFLRFMGKVGFGFVPSGASTGEREALELRDDAFAKRVESGEARFGLYDASGKRYMSDKEAIRLLIDGNATTKAQAIKWLKTYSNKGTRAAQVRAEFLLGKLQEAIDSGEVDPRMEGQVDEWLKAMEEQFGGNWELKNYFGANTILAISTAALRLAAELAGVQPYELNQGPEAVGEVLPQANILNGGEHADNKVDVQETMISVVPDPTAEGLNAVRTESDAVFVKGQIFQRLKSELKRRGLNTNVGDEGGFAPNVNANSDYLEIASQVIKASPWGDLYGIQIGFSKDPAFSERSFKEGEETLYWLEGETDESGAARPITLSDGTQIGTVRQLDVRDFPVLVLTSEELNLYWNDLVRRYPIVSLEDGFDQNDMKGWARFTAVVNKASKVGTDGFVFPIQNKLGFDVVGDDLLVTNLRQLKAAVEGATIRFAGKTLVFPPNTVNSILVKINQVGSISETKELIKWALEHGISVKISHRSGETEDTIIADIAKWATTLSRGEHALTGRTPRVWIKTGSMSRSDRTAKYNRLLEINELERAAASPVELSDDNKAKINAFLLKMYRQLHEGEEIEITEDLALTLFGLDVPTGRRLYSAVLENHIGITFQSTADQKWEVVGDIYSGVAQALADGQVTGLPTRSIEEITAASPITPSELLLGDAERMLEHIRKVNMELDANLPVFQIIALFNRLSENSDITGASELKEEIEVASTVFKRTTDWVFSSILEASSFLSKDRQQGVRRIEESRSPIFRTIIGETNPEIPRAVLSLVLRGEIEALEKVVERIDEEAGPGGSIAGDAHIRAIGAYRSLITHAVHMQKVGSTVAASPILGFGSPAQSKSDRVREIIINRLGVYPEKATDEASLIEDLGADSLDTVEVVMALEEEFDIDIPDEDAEQLRTVGDHISYVEEHASSPVEPVREKVRSIVVSQLGVDPDEVHDDASFTDDLGADDLDMVELVMEFEDGFSVKISDDEEEGLKTVGDVVRHIEAKTAASPIQAVALEDLEIRSEDFALESNIDLSVYPKSEAFVKQEVALLQSTSNSVTVVDETMMEQFIADAIEAGLIWEGDDGNIYYISHPKDTARAARPTVIVSDDPTDLSERVNWEHTESALTDVLNKQLGAHDGEITYVIPFVNGTVGTPTAFPGIQVTDNVHVILSYFHLYRHGIGIAALEAIEQLDDDYLQVSHATHPKGGTLDDVRRARPTHPQDTEDRKFAFFKPLKYLKKATDRIKKYGSNVVRLVFSGYGGNAIAAKKFALRFFNALGVRVANQSMAHQFFTIYHDKETGEVTGIVGSYSSMGGKTNEGAIKVAEDLEGKIDVYLVSEDLVRSFFLAKLEDGSLELLPKDLEERDAYLERNKEKIVEVIEMGHNLEDGTFLVAEGINDVELGRAVKAIAKGGVLGVNLAYKFRWDVDKGRLVVVRPWFERHSEVRPVQDVLAEYIAFREGTLEHADKGVGWHDWLGVAMYQKVGRLLMGKRINYEDVKFLERILRENEGVVEAFLDGSIPYTDTLHASLSRDDYDRAVDIAKVVMTAIGEKQWNQPNARISVPLENYDNFIGNMPQVKREELGLDSPWGYQKHIQKWGGRSPALEPLVRAQTSVEQGIYDGMFTRSLSTAAMEGKPGQVGEAPFAQEPFYSTTIGRYAAHLLDRARLTMMFFAHNNFFKESKTAEQRSRRGKFIWGGFSDNVRINLWLIKARKYLRGEMSDDQRAAFQKEYTETPVGLIPTPQASLFDGLRVSEGGVLTEQDIIDLTTFDLEGWRAEVIMRTNYAVEKLKMDIPDAIRREHEKLVDALNKELSSDQQIILPEAWTEAQSWEEMEAEKYAQSAAASPVTISEQTQFLDNNEVFEGNWKNSLYRLITSDDLIVAVGNRIHESTFQSLVEKGYLEIQVEADPEKGTKAKASITPHVRENIIRSRRATLGLSGSILTFFSQTLLDEQRDAEDRITDFRDNVAPRIPDGAQAIVFVQPEYRALAGLLWKDTNIILGAEFFNVATVAEEIDAAVNDGVEAAMVGHSKRRQKGEGLQDADVNTILHEIVEDGRLWYKSFVVEDAEGEDFLQRSTEQQIRDQVQEGLAGFSSAQLRTISVTVEPTADISTKEGAAVIDRTTKVDLTKVRREVILVHSAMSELDSSVADLMHYKYGASMNPDNAEAILAMQISGIRADGQFLRIRGGIPGGASQTAAKFVPTMVNGIAGATASSPVQEEVEMTEAELLQFNVAEQTEFGNQRISEAQQKDEQIVWILEDLAFGRQHDEEVEGPKAALLRDVIISNEDIPLVPVKDENGQVVLPARRGTHILRTTSEDTVVIATEMKKGRVVNNLTVVLNTSDLDEGKLEDELRRAVLEKLDSKFVFKSIRSTRELMRKLSRRKDGVVIDGLDIKVLPSVKRTMVSMRLIYNEPHLYIAPKSPPVALPIMRSVEYQSSKVESPDFSHRDRPTNVAMVGLGEVNLRVLRNLLLHKNSSKVRVTAVYGNTAEEAREKILDDSLYGSYLNEKDVRIVREGGREYIEIYLAQKNEVHKILFISDRSIKIKDLPWEELGINIVVEGIKGKTIEEMRENIEAGADMAILTAPGKVGPDGRRAKAAVIGTITAGDLELAIDDQVCSGLSCTTGSLATIVRHVMGLDVSEMFDRVRSSALRFLDRVKADISLVKPFEIPAANVLTIHAATNTNQLVDTTKGPSIIAGEVIFGPTGAAKALGQIFPSLRKNFSATAMRNGLPTGSLTSAHKIKKVKRGDIVTPESFNQRVRERSQVGDGAGTVVVSDDVYSSAQIIGRSESGILFAPGTRVIRLDKGTFLSGSLSWYDNVSGYSARISDAVQVFADELYYKGNEASSVRELVRKPMYEEVLGYTEATETEESQVVILDRLKLLENGGALDDLTREAIANPVDEVREAAKQLLREIRVQSGTISMSLHDVQDGLAEDGMDIFANDVENLDLTTIYRSLRAQFKQAERDNVGVTVVKMTQPSPEAMRNLPEFQDGYAATITALANAAAVKEGYSGQFIYFHLTVDSSSEDFESHRSAYNAGTLQARLLRDFDKTIDQDRRDNLRNTNVDNTLFEDFVDQNVDLLSLLEESSAVPEGPALQRLIDRIKQSLEEAVSAGVFNLRVDLGALVNRDLAIAFRKAVESSRFQSVESLLASESERAQQIKAMHSGANTQVVAVGAELTRFVRTDLEIGHAVLRRKFETGELQEMLERVFGRTSDQGRDNYVLSPQDLAFINHPTTTFDQVASQYARNLTALDGEGMDSPVALEIVATASSPIRDTEVQDILLQEQLKKRATEEGLVAPTTIRFSKDASLETSLLELQWEMLSHIAQMARRGELRALQLKDRMIEYMEAKIFPKGNLSDYVQDIFDRSETNRRGAKEYEKAREAWLEKFSRLLPDIIEAKTNDIIEIELELLVGNGKDDEVFGQLRSELLSAFHREMWDLFNTVSVDDIIEEEISDAHRGAGLNGRRSNVESMHAPRYQDRHGSPDPIPAGRTEQDHYRHEGGVPIEAVSARPQHLREAIDTHVDDLTLPIPITTKQRQKEEATDDGGILDEKLDIIARGIANGSLLTRQPEEFTPQNGEEQLATTLAENAGQSEKFLANFRKLLTKGLLWRIAKILRIIVLPVDQSGEHGTIRNNMKNPAMTSPYEQLDFVRQAQLNANVQPFGSAMQMLNQGFGEDQFLILKANGARATQYGPQAIHTDSGVHASDADIMRAGELDGGAIGITIQPGSTPSKEQHARYKRMGQTAKRAGMIFIAWIYSRGGDLEKNKAQRTYFDVTLADILLGKDIGADVAKVKLPTDEPALFRNPAVKAALDARGLKYGSQAEQVALIQMIAGNMPVFFSGGALGGDETLDHAVGAIAYGTHTVYGRLQGILGNIMGRNIFQVPFLEGINRIVRSFATHLGAADEDVDLSLTQRDRYPNRTRDLERLERQRAAREKRAVRRQSRRDPVDNLTEYAHDEWRPDSPINRVRESLRVRDIVPPPFGARLLPNGEVDNRTFSDRTAEIMDTQIFESPELERNLEDLLRRNEGVTIFPYRENQRVVQGASAYSATIDELRSISDQWNADPRNPKLALSVSLAPKGDGYVDEDYYQLEIWGNIEEAKRLGATVVVVQVDITDQSYNSNMQQVLGIQDKARELGLPVFLVMNPKSDPGNKTLTKPRSMGVVGTALFDASMVLHVPGFGAVPMPNGDFQDAEDAKEYAARDRGLFKREDLGSIDTPEGRTRLLTFSTGLGVRSFLMAHGLDNKMPTHIVNDVAAGLAGGAIGTVITREARLATKELETIVALHQTPVDEITRTGKELLRKTNGRIQSGIATASSPITASSPVTPEDERQKDTNEEGEVSEEGQAKPGKPAESSITKAAKRAGQLHSGGPEKGKRTGNSSFGASSPVSNVPAIISDAFEVDFSRVQPDVDLIELGIVDDSHIRLLAERLQSDGGFPVTFDDAYRFITVQDAIDFAEASSPVQGPREASEGDRVVRGSFLQGFLSRSFRLIAHQNGDMSWHWRGSGVGDGGFSHNMFYDKGAGQTTTDGAKPVDGNAIPSAVRSYIGSNTSNMPTEHARRRNGIQERDRSNLRAALRSSRSSSSPLEEVGGIDLDAEHLNLMVERDGNGIPLPVSMQPLEIININGLVPVILNVAPVNMPLIFGANFDENSDPLADTEPDNSLDSARNEYFDKITEVEELAAS